MSARFALPLYNEWRRRGGAGEGPLERLGLSEAHLRAIQGRIPVETWCDLHAAYTQESGDPAFAVRAVESLDRSVFPLELLLVGSQANVRAGIARVQPPFSPWGLRRAREGIAEK